MAITEPLSVFLADFGVPVSDGVTSTTGLLDRPGEIILGGAVVSVDYALTLKATDYPTLKYADTLTVDGGAYVVRHVQPLDDGAFKIVYLAKD